MLPLILAAASLSLKLFRVRVQVRCRLPIQGSSRAAERAAHDLMAGFCRRAPVCAVMNDDTYRIAVGLELDRRMRPYDDKLMDYNSPAFERGFAAGESCQPRLADDHTMSDVERARYREGWLMGSCEPDAWTNRTRVGAQHDRPPNLC
jgi:hypothetical protein